jgi:hypothetical protein
VSPSAAVDRIPPEQRAYRFEGGGLPIQDREVRFELPALYRMAPLPVQPDVGKWHAPA